MLRRFLLTSAVLLATGIAAAAVLYQFFGLRVLLDGGGTPRPTFVVDPVEHAEVVARHREAQRQESPRPQAPVPAPAAPEPLSSGVKAEQPPPVAGPRPYWTDFRGPLRDGHYVERRIRTDWSASGLQPVWKQPIGAGYASFVIARDRAFTIEQRGTEEVAAAYDMRTGRELWTTRWSALFRESLGGDGPRATPTWSDGVVYVLGATGELRALDEASGKTLWAQNILEDNGASNLEWGMSASPLLVDGTVVVLPGGSKDRSVAAYDRRTGKRVWAALPDKQAYSSPMLVTLGGVRQILVFTAHRLVGLATDGSSVLWEYPWKTPFDINAGQPIVIGDNRVFMSSGYGSGAAVIEVTRAGARFNVREIWRNNRMKNQFTSSVLHDGFIYGMDESILACIDAATGELRWKGGRYGYGQVMLASGHLIVLTEDGDLALVRATPEGHDELVRFPAVSGKTWNHPAMADGYLLVRNLAEMAAFDLR